MARQGVMVLEGMLELQVERKAGSEAASLAAAVMERWAVKGWLGSGKGWGRQQLSWGESVGINRGEKQDLRNLDRDRAGMGVGLGKGAAGIVDFSGVS